MQENLILSMLARLGSYSPHLGEDTPRLIVVTVSSLFHHAPEVRGYLGRVHSPCLPLGQRLDSRQHAGVG